MFSGPLQVHVLPREILGESTFSVALKLMKTFPLWFTDWLLVFYTWLTLGNVANYGFTRPKEGPMALKGKVGKTPILDVGTLDKIKTGHIKVSSSIWMWSEGVDLVASSCLFNCSRVISAPFGGC